MTHRTSRGDLISRNFRSRRQLGNGARACAVVWRCLRTLPGGGTLWAATKIGGGVPIRKCNRQDSEMKVNLSSLSRQHSFTELVPLISSNGVPGSHFVQVKIFLDLGLQICRDLINTCGKEVSVLSLKSVVWNLSPESLLFLRPGNQTEIRLRPLYGAKFFEFHFMLLVSLGPS